jgi:hypothetical protein
VLAIAVGAASSFAWSFVLAALILRMKHWRNGVLLARGGLPYKDCIFSRPLWFMMTFLGVATIIPIGLFVSSTVTALALAALGPPTALALVPLVAIVSQARHES